jgi:flagellar biosynthesis/type III secretory pathway M-ring protein FliF/YscJ
MAAPASAENTGSLTGHILNQGWSDINQHASRNNRKVVVVMAIVLLTLVALSLLVVFTANDLIATLFGGISKGLG